MILDSEKFILIHIGKCGGSSIRNELKKNNYKFILKHVKQANKINFNKHKNYVILIRNPIKRFISAYNWRYQLLINDKKQENRFDNEKETLIKTKNINNLIKILKEDIHFLDNNYIHHIKENIESYLGKLLQKCLSKNILAVICAETLEEDLKDHFNIDLKTHKRNNKNNKTELNSEEYNFLKNYLKNEYKCIDKLYELNCIDKNKYDILSK